MHAEFDDPQRATSYIAEGVLHDFPNAELEVVLCDQRTNRSENLVCRTDGLANELFRLCRKFPGASVDYTPDHPNGLLGTIVSTEHRYHGAERQRDRQRGHDPYSSLKDGRYVMVLLHETQRFADTNASAR